MLKHWRLFILACILQFSAQESFGELNKAHRFFEIGVEVDVGASNAWFGVRDIFNSDRTIVVDFLDMSNKLSQGLAIDAHANTIAFINLDVGPSKRTHIGFSVGVTGQAHGAIPQGIIDFIAHGNEFNKPVTLDLDVRAEAYLDASVEIGFFVGKQGISLKPSAFVPLVYASADSATFSAMSSTNGEMIIDGNADLIMRSQLPLNNFNDTAWLNNIINNIGFDFSIGYEYPLFPFMDVGLNVQHIPILPGKMDYVMKQSIIAHYEGSFTNLINEAGSIVQMGDMINTEERFEARRPLKVGIESAIRPFFSQEWFTLYPSVYFGFRLNGEKDFLFIDYNLRLRLKTGYDILALDLATSRIDEVFIQSVGLMINFRLIQIDVAVSSRAANFVKSWQLAGLGAKIGVRIGF